MKEAIAQIKKQKLVAIIRIPFAFDVVAILDALLEGGVTVAEITLNSFDALANIETAIARFAKEGMLIGAGTVLTPADVETAANAGAQFIVTPATPPGMVTAAHQHQLPILAGAYTPLEALNAYNEGADFIKLFPAEVGGIAYLKALKAPLPHLSFIPTGGINSNNAADWLQAGATALGVGSSLVDATLVKEKAWKELTARAKAFTQIINNTETA